VLRDMIEGIHCIKLHKKGHVQINKHLQIPVSLIGELIEKNQLHGVIVNVLKVRKPMGSKEDCCASC